MKARTGLNPFLMQRTRRDQRVTWLMRIQIGILLSIATVLLLTSTALVAQKRPPRRNRPPGTAAINYSKFSHTTKKHQAACDTCHQVPTVAWQKVSAFPDITDYPGHNACLSCHRSQFFKGARPPICSVCHSKVSPRDDVRFKFPDPDAPSQFTIEFPHDRHQDVIALLKTIRDQQQPVAFSHAPFRSTTADEKSQTYNNCSICHAQQTTLPETPAAGWPDGFQPQPATFKSLPVSHASCFNCHWNSQQPVAENCAGCHKLTASEVPLNTAARISLKFMHEGGGEKKNHIAECTTCHINITKSVSLRGLKPDVPITSCTECHNKEGLRQDVSKELVAIDKDRAFVCVYCHTSNVGSLDPPASHYLIAERPALKRKEIK
jgi:Outer membrane cytochrome MtrC/MtrF-like, domains II/IV